ncbi:SusC/RagA family TonB-linked outer membrane protein [Mediterranea massiliensis]|uniref:SusC/RagA family TonB-linked outer membrane protein n=1 Tax=Mediterranea massiliensis TaxID=1841865 RepID=UPI0025A478A4|nr:TonB-dependent receptor [Mediterranea massiliensis]MDM8338340.1 TonB-dependent receptor [Mediterranea massiliensis]
MSNKMKNMRAALLFFIVAVISLGVSAQNVTVKGTVKDKTGETVIGASVVEKGNTTNGTITDIDGNYSLNVPSNATLVFSFVGMKSYEIAVKGQTTINVTMEDDSQALEEVVVIGYGSVKRKDLTGSVATVNSDVLAAVPVANATEALQGKMAGVQITTTEGSPDADMTIRVRGGGSITQSNEPLFIVDGFPVESISDIPASDIEDITVLKDASSTAIYGSRGANGVILVTTKSGKEGKINVSYNAYYSWKKVAKKLDVLNARDYTEWQYELANLTNKVEDYEEHFGSYQDIDLYDNVATNDWQDLTFGRTGHTFNHSLNINGGGEKMKYAFSYARMDDKAIMEMSDFVRDNLSLKLNSKLSKRISVDMQARWSKTKVNGAGANETSGVYNTDKRLRYAIQYTPYPVAGITDAGDDDGTNSSFYNPLTALRDNDQRKTRTQLNMSGAFTWEIIDNLKFKAEFGYDTYKQDTKKYMGASTYYVQNVPSSSNQGKPAITLINQYRTKYRNTNTLNYDFKKLFDKNSLHHLNALVGQEYIIEKNEELTNTVHGFPSSFTASDCWNLTTQGTPYEITDFYDPDDILLSYFGRVNYDFDSKYIVSATFRADGSSKFAEENRWGFFPSAAVAWRISAEPFMRRTNHWLDDLKLRFSYGTAGNNNIPSGLLTQEYVANATTWINGYTSYWAPSKTMANPDLKWETTITRNLGLDFTILGGKINGTIEAYLNNTKDLLIQYPVSGTGYDYQYRNMGETRNKGFEVSLNYYAINKKNFSLSVGANISFNKNEVVSLGDLQSIDNISTAWASTEIDQDFVIRTGEPIGQIWGYKSAGRYEVSDFDIAASQAAGKWVLKEGVVDCSGILGTSVQPGSMKLMETKAEKTGTITTADRQVIGDTNPLAIGGFNLNARIYNFDFSASFNYSIGNDVYNANAIEYTQTSKYQYRNLISTMQAGSRWTNIDAMGNYLNWNNADELAALNANTTMWSPYTGKYILTDYYVEDASFLRLSTLTLGYTLPQAWLKKIGISNLRFYATAYNVFCLTNYSGFDPEVSTMRKTNLTPGVDYSAYPKSRQFVIGLNLNF